MSIVTQSVQIAKTKTAQGIEANSGLSKIPDRLCPHCWNWTGGRPWGGSDQLWGYHCQCGWQRVITSPAIAEAKERVREARLNRVGGAR